MFGYRHRFGGRGRGQCSGRGFSRGFGPGRGACYRYYMTHGTWPDWLRWAGDPGYGRAMVAQNVAPQAWTTANSAPMNEVEPLRQEVQELQSQIDKALQQLSDLSV